jgi:hypothetical protein
MKCALTMLTGNEPEAPSAAEGLMADFQLHRRYWTNACVDHVSAATSRHVEALEDQRVGLDFHRPRALQFRFPVCC